MLINSPPRWWWHPLSKLSWSIYKISFVQTCESVVFSPPTALLNFFFLRFRMTSYSILETNASTEAIIPDDLHGATAHEVTPFMSMLRKNSVSHQHVMNEYLKNWAKDGKYSEDTDDVRKKRESGYMPLVNKYVQDPGVTLYAPLNPAKSLCKTAYTSAATTTWQLISLSPAGGNPFISVVSAPESPSSKPRHDTNTTSPPC